MRNLYLFLISILILSSCVTKKKYLALQTNCQETKVILEKTRTELASISDQKTNLNSELKVAQNKIILLEDQVKDLRETNSNLMERLSELSQVSVTGIEALKEQNKFIQDLTNKIQTKDSLNLILVTNLKRSLDDVDSEDIDIQVKKGVVFISLSDEMLFTSGSSTISPKAGETLSKIAKIIKDYSHLDILVEGHTDNRPMSNSCVKDNWDLSAKRATAVVRYLQTKYKIKPERMTAGARSEYVPKVSNKTAKGRATNRRIEIIILPKLDQFYDLLQDPDAKK